MGTGKEGGGGGGGGKEPLHPGRPSLRSTKYFETKNEVEDLTRRWAKARRIVMLYFSKTSANVLTTIEEDLLPMVPT